MRLQKKQRETLEKRSDSFKQIIYLVRHGETDANKNDVYQGSRIDQSLNDTGKLQAHHLGCWLEKYSEEISVIYTSPAKRALETAALLHLLPEIIIEQDLRETDYGDWCGKTPVEAQQWYPDIFQEYYNGNPRLVKFPHGERFEAARNRILNAFKRILERNPAGNLLIVAHGGTNPIIISALLKTKYFRSIKQSNACLNVIEREGDQFKIILLNSTAHLL